MKKLLSLFTAAFMLLAAGCSQPVKSDDDSVVLPPTRIGEGIAHVTLADRYTFETAFSKADAVARIKIGNWLSEDELLNSTFFEATVLQCFKGVIPENFILKQSGTASATIQGYPLFTYGNELLLFLGKGSSSDYGEFHAPQYDTFYWIIGSYSAFLDTAYDSGGNRYYADRYGFLGESMYISTNYVYQKDILSEVYASAVGSDPLLTKIADEQHLYSYVFYEQDVLGLIDRYNVYSN